MAERKPLVMNAGQIEQLQSGDALDPSIVDHGGLTGLGDDDHTQYLRADGSRNLSGNLTVDVGILIDGRDLSVDGAKLDGIEAGADVTDATNVAAAGAAMAGGAFHDGFSDFVANEHIDWTNAADNFSTTGSITVAADNQKICLGATQGDMDLFSDGTDAVVDATGNIFLDAGGTIKLGGNLDVNGKKITTSVTDGNIQIAPNGEGAIFVLDEGTTAYGNKACDIQRSRTTDAQCASGTCSVIIGGYNNTASGSFAVIITGVSNVQSGGRGAIIAGEENVNAGYECGIVTGYQGDIDSDCDYSAVVAGLRNELNASDYAGILAGGDNTINAGLSGIVAGTTNTISGSYSFIGAGNTNTVSSSVQSAGIAAGYLNTVSAYYTFIGAGRNNIVAGYAGVIGGGRNNEIQSTNCLYAFVGAGRYNKILNSASKGNYSGVLCGSYNEISGDESAIGTGYDNDISADRCFIGSGYQNVVSADYGFIGSGQGHSIAGTHSVIAGGYDHTVSSGAGYVCIGGGYQHTASADYVFIGGGYGNEVTADVATVPGGYYGKAGLYGQVAHASGRFAAMGDAQTSVLVARNSTTDAATSTELFLNGSSARMTLNDGDTWFFTINVVARETNGSQRSCAYETKGVIERTGSTTTLVNSSSNSWGPSGTPFGSCTVSADDTNDSLKIAVTGVASTTIRWVARIELTQVNG